VGDRFEAGDRDPGEALEPLLALADGHPQRATMLAHHLYAEVRRGQEGDTDAWSRALGAVGGKLQGEFEAIWSGLTGREQRVATAIAENRTSLYSRESQRAYGIAKTGSYQSAIESLRDSGEIVEADTATKWRLIDPCLLFGCEAAARGPFPPGRAPSSNSSHGMDGAPVALDASAWVVGLG
jgi:hypothetical protein